MSPPTALQTFRDFHALVEEELPALLPAELRGFVAERMGGVLKVHYGLRPQHFELWFRDGGLEVAFHLEGRPEQDDPVAATLERRLRAIRRSLGGDLRLEPFGRDWLHLFELWPDATRRTEELARDAAVRLAELIRLLEPIRRAALPGDDLGDV